MASRAALIGREQEAAWLGARLDRAVAGEGSLVLLSGEAGVGKSRLADAIGDDPGVTVLRGAASQTAAEPHAPLVAALRS